MKPHVVLLLMLLIPFFAFAQDQKSPYISTCTLRLHIEGFRNQKGDADVTIFRSPDGWPEDDSRSFFQDSFPITGKEITVDIKIPAGKYAIGVLHDENSNHKADRNFLQLPTEGFGFSNNPKVWLTAPSFHTATVPIACPETTLSIRLLYK